MPAHGLLLIDKASGMTSHDVVARSRRILRMKGIGHAGTLDPMATGLMVLLLGEATKLSDYILNGDKSYQATILLGRTTDTLDITGTTLSEKAVGVSEDQVRQALFELTGEFQIEVPSYSAVKVNGQKLYDLARGQEIVKVQKPVKTMKFFDLKEIQVELPFVRLELSCSKGSFIRSFAEELGKKLETGACLSALRRTASFPFQLSQALTLEELEQRLSRPEPGAGESIDLSALEAFVPFTQCLADWPSIKVEGLDEKLMSNGQIPHHIHRLLESHYLPYCRGKGVRVMSRRTGQVLNLLQARDERRFRIQKVFNYNT